MNRFSSRWNERWLQTPPIAWLLRDRFPERWVRFHSLPESKRYAESDLEHLEVLRRHHAVLEVLGASLETRVVTVTVRYPEEEYSPELAAGEIEAWTWQGDADEVGVGQLFVNEGLLSALNGLLRMVANDECRGVMILPLDLAWIFHPYDGGADVITATSAERDVLAARFASWRSARPDGL